jgi:Family of unknown function (DUF6088)
MQTVGNKVLRRIRGLGRGVVVIPKDFLDLGSRAAIDQTLSRLVKRGVLKRPDRGLYYYPRVSARLGELSASPDAIANAIARKRGSKLLVSDAQAANRLGLTTQVPARSVYYVNGPPRTVKRGHQSVDIRRNSRRVGGKSDTILRALRYLGRDRIDDLVVGRLRNVLSLGDKRALNRDAHLAPDWMRSVINQITTTDATA